MKATLLFLLSILSANAATLRWDDTNAVGTSYVISNRVGGSWQFLGQTTLKSFPVTLIPGTNTFSLVASNGLLSDPASTSTNFPSRVFNVIIEASATPEGPWMVKTNLPTLTLLTDANQFYRAKLNWNP